MNKEELHNSAEEMINSMIMRAKTKEGFDTDRVSDGWHTFGELYDFRLAYNAMAFNAISARAGLMSLGDQYEMRVRSGYVDPLVHKSWKHHDGEYCFGEEKKWFIVAAKLPTGTITNHYKAEHWDKFKIPEVEKSLFPFDGHTGQDVIQRIMDFLK